MCLPVHLFSQEAAPKGQRPGLTQLCTSQSWGSGVWLTEANHKGLNKEILPSISFVSLKILFYLLPGTEGKQEDGKEDHGSFSVSHIPIWSKQTIIGPYRNLIPPGAFVCLCLLPTFFRQHESLLRHEQRVFFAFNTTNPGLSESLNYEVQFYPNRLLLTSRNNDYCLGNHGFLKERKSKTRKLHRGKT